MLISVYKIAVFIILSIIALDPAVMLDSTQQHNRRISAVGLSNNASKSSKPFSLIMVSTALSSHQIISPIVDSDEHTID